MKENVVVNKTFLFAIGIVKVYQKLTAEKKEFVLSKQLLRCGTSIGANVEESEGGVSRKEFISKFQIAYKEAKETKYWLRLLHSTNYIEEQDFKILLSQIDEILKIIVSILKSTKKEPIIP